MRKGHRQTVRRHRFADRLEHAPGKRAQLRGQSGDRGHGLVVDMPLDLEEARQQFVVGGGQAVLGGGHVGAFGAGPVAAARLAVDARGFEGKRRLGLQDAFADRGLVPSSKAISSQRSFSPASRESSVSSSATAWSSAPKS
jgi:hypothetical protein